MASLAWGELTAKVRSAEPFFNMHRLFQTSAADNLPTSVDGAAWNTANRPGRVPE